MPQNIKILTWNIQNYGDKKSGFPDVMKAIASLVLLPRPDIFVLLEVNTTDHTTAVNLAKKMAKVLNSNSKLIYNADEYRVCVISPNTGREFYAFFVRDHTTIMPLLAKKRSDDSDVSLIGSDGLDYSDVKFVSANIKAGINVLKNFPLLSPDVEDYSYNFRDLGIPKWTAVRLPVLGTFWCTGAAGNNRLLPIIACHFAANHNQAKLQVEKLSCFSIMRGLGPAPTSRFVTPQAPIVMKVVNGGTTNVTLQSYILTGDFNMNYLSAKEAGWYDQITGNTFPELNAKLFIKSNTHLVTYSQFSPRDYKNTGDLAISCYDNLMLGVNPAAANPATAKTPDVSNVPERVRKRGVTLDECVEHYKELDQRGFVSSDYDYMATDFAKQLAGDKSHNINIAGSLVGARLISDHLPVEFVLTLP